MVVRSQSQFMKSREMEWIVDLTIRAKRTITEENGELEGHEVRRMIDEILLERKKMSMKGDWEEPKTESDC